MNVTFANDFRDQPNQVYIALCGDPKIMIEKMAAIAKEIQTHGRPLQGTSLYCGTTVQVIRPSWQVN